MPEGKSVNASFRALPLLCSTLTVLLGLMTFIGWISGLSLLASVRAKYIPMAPSTALCFSLLGIALLLQLRRPALRWIPRVLAAVVLIIACAKLVEILGGLHFGIDAWFVRNPGMFGAVPTGRMAPMTALNFVFTALGLFALTRRRPEKWASALGALATIVSAVVLIGYWYGTPLLYGGRIIPVALSTACGFFLCGIAVVTAAGADGWPLRVFMGGSTRAVLLRAFVPVIVAAALINGWVSATLLKHVHTNPAVTSALGAFAFAALITAIVSQVSRVVGGRIDRAEEARNLAQAALLELNAQLERRVEKRTRELREKNQQMEEELKMARELQVALLPQQFPTVPADVTVQESALRFLSLYFPTGDVSGDFFRVFPVGEKAAGVFICDVMGHGVRSALITSVIRGLVEEHAKSRLTQVSYLRASTARSRSFLSRPARPCLRPVSMSSPMCSAQSCALPTPDIPARSTSGEATHSPKNSRVRKDVARPWEFFPPRTTRLRQGRWRRATWSCSSRTDFLRSRMLLERSSTRSNSRLR